MTGMAGGASIPARATHQHPLSPDGCHPYTVFLQSFAAFGPDITRIVIRQGDVVSFLSGRCRAGITDLPSANLRARVVLFKICLCCRFRACIVPVT